MKKLQEKKFMEANFSPVFGKARIIIVLSAQELKLLRMINTGDYLCVRSVDPKVHSTLNVCVFIIIIILCRKSIFTLDCLC